MGEDVRQDATGPPSSGATERVSVQAAAEHLGITVDAIRKRVQRDTIAHEKDSDGRVWILLDTDRTRHDETGQRQDVRSDDVAVEVVTELRDQVAYLREQLDQEREARTEERRRHDTIIAQLSQANAALASRVPELEAPASGATEARESPETAAEEPYSTHAPPKPQTPVQQLSERVEEAMDRGGVPPEGQRSSQHHPVERPSWWRRFFGFE